MDAVENRAPILGCGGFTLVVHYTSQPAKNPIIGVMAAAQAAVSRACEY
jgi:hypothetical protein